MTGGTITALGSAVAALVGLLSLWSFLIAPLARDVAALQAQAPIGRAEHKEDLRQVRKDVASDIEVAILTAALARCEEKP